MKKMITLLSVGALMVSTGAVSVFAEDVGSVGMAVSEEVTTDDSLDLFEERSEGSDTLSDEDPVEPSEPAEPSTPSEPSEPTPPTSPAEPSEPISNPAEPVEPSAPKDTPKPSEPQGGADLNAGLTQSVSAIPLVSSDSTVTTAELSAVATTNTVGTLPETGDTASFSMTLLGALSLVGTLLYQRKQLKE